MDFGDLLDLLIKKENKRLQRWIGGVLVGLPLAFIIGGGFAQGVDGHGVIFSGGWFREIFVVAFSLFGLLGILLLIISFCKRSEDDEDDNKEISQ